MRPAMQKALQAMKKEGHCKELLRVFKEECLSDTEGHSAEWKEGLETLSKTQWLQLCEYLTTWTNDLHPIACLTCLCWSLRDSTSSAVVTALGEIIVHLHGSLLQAPPEAQDAIAQCCEAYWVSHAPGAEGVIPQLIPYLVVQALDGEKASAIKRLRDVQDALSLLDFEDNSSRYDPHRLACIVVSSSCDQPISLLKDLLLRCFVSPTFLKSNDGIHILGDLFHLESSFTDDIHATIRNQLPMQKKSVVKRYGLIYYKAWHTAHVNEFPSLLKIEEDCIQPFLYHSIYVQNPSLCTNLHALLQAFFDAKQECDPMLYRLVEPILWRGLSASHDQVRKQAAILLFQGFPYQDPIIGKEEMDQLLQKQFDVMLQLVQDTAPATRVVSVHGLAKVLSLYWELVPAEYIQQFLFWLFEMVQDTSSTPVRVAVLQGLPLILDNHMSHPILKSLLPKVRCDIVHRDSLFVKLAPYLHDKQETVRAAFCQLLVRVKSIRNMHFYDIAPVDKCLLRLVMDGGRPAVAKPLTDLFLRSYFPQGASDASQIARTLSMIEEYPAASRVFYRHVVHYSSVGAICKLVVLLLRFLASTDEDVDPSTASGILWVTVDLLQSVAKRLQHDKRYADCRRFLKQELDSEALASLFQTYSTHPHVLAGLWHAISFLPFKDEFILHALDQLSKLECSSNKQLLVGILRCMVQWKEEVMFAETLLDQLHPKRVARANVALLLVCLEQLLLLCDLEPVAASMVSSLEKHWVTFQKHLEPSSGVLYAKVVWTLSQLLPADTRGPPVVLCEIWEWLSSHDKKRKADDESPSVDCRLELVPVLCEAMFSALQSSNAVEFMQKVVELSMDEPALNAQLMAIIVASDVELDEKLSGVLVSALVEANSASCAWLAQMQLSTGVCQSLWKMIREETDLAEKIMTKWPEQAIRNVLTVGLQSEVELPELAIELLKACRSTSWVEGVASLRVKTQLRQAAIKIS
ncbi:Aste57867_746 [Aphanomyces stellatus]|uniref:Aste57867_746 protein n=1 Tax=Aphanomyces stellatus TaxID=120398 RepID=A0A485K7H8_9STRA|nr:hypothetical protein As57867_000745 [Aphanomyces stellatus]VFT77970.1 Aste57867_746 [Aphanomyces stellatus]